MIYAFISKQSYVFQNIIFKVKRKVNILSQIPISDFRD